MHAKTRRGLRESDGPKDDGDNHDGSERDEFINNGGLNGEKPLWVVIVKVQQFAPIIFLVPDLDCA